VKVPFDDYVIFRKDLILHEDIILLAGMASTWGISQIGMAQSGVEVKSRGVGYHSEIRESANPESGAFLQEVRLHDRRSA
jgi:hypothetical protein